MQICQISIVQYMRGGDNESDSVIGQTYHE